MDTFSKDAASELAAKKKSAADKAKLDAAINAATGSTPGKTSSSGSVDFHSGNNLDPHSWNKVVSGSTFNMSKFPIPTLSALGTQATGEQILQAFSKMVYQDPKTWQNIRPTLLALGGGTMSKKPKPWTPGDETAIENWLGQLHYNSIDLTPGNKTVPTPPDVMTAFTSGMKNVKTFGVVGSKVSASPLVSVPASADLTKIAQSAFSTTLGRSASPQEAAAFAKAYQDTVNTYGQSKNDAKKQSAFNPPEQPIAFQQSGQKNAPIVNSAPTDTTAIMSPPSASTAASNFAARTNPTQASAQAAADGLGQFLSMLKGS